MAKQDCTPVGYLDFSKTKRKGVQTHYLRQFHLEITKLKRAFKDWMRCKELHRQNPRNTEHLIWVNEARFRIISATGRLLKAFKWMKFAGIQIKRD